MNKKIFITIALTFTLALPAVAIAKSTNAANPNGLPSAVSSVVSSPTSSASPNDDLDAGAKTWKDKLDTAKQARDDQKVDRFKALANTLIDNRIGLLQNLKTRIQENDNIASTTQTTLIADIDKAITGLTTLKTEIASQTDLSALKEKIKSIFTSFRIYEVVAPRDLGQGLAAQGQYILGRLEAIQRQLQQMLDQSKNAGKDTSAIQTLIDQVTAKLTDAKAQLAIAEEKFKSMTPDNTDAAKAARDAGKEAMKKAKQDLKDAHTLLKQISDQLKTLTANSPSPSSSISPVISPSIIPSPSTS